MSISYILHVFSNKNCITLCDLIYKCYSLTFVCLSSFRFSVEDIFLKKILENVRIKTKNNTTDEKENKIRN